MIFPDSVEYLPCAQPALPAPLMHSVEPGSVLFQPDGQFLQTEMDVADISSENLPCAHSLQTKLEAAAFSEE